MGDFKKTGGFKGKPDFKRSDSGRPSFGSRRPEFGRRESNGERPQMFTATCDECHKQCEVPFRPSGSKPVYCHDCFGSKKEARGDYAKRESSGYPRREFSAPAPSVNAVPDNRIGDLKKQMDAMNAKIDMLLEIVGGKAPVAKTVEPKKESAPQVSFMDQPVEAAEKKSKKKLPAKKKPASKK